MFGNKKWAWNKQFDFQSQVSFFYIFFIYLHNLFFACIC